MMKRMTPVVLLAIAVGGCGGPQETTTTDTDEGTGTVEGADNDLQETTATTVEDDERSALIALLRTYRGTNTEDWPEEMRLVLHPGRLQPLVGMTRDELTAQFGEPNAGPVHQAEDRSAWKIGSVPEQSRSHAPIMTITFDDAGVSTEANFLLSE